MSIVYCMIYAACYFVLFRYDLLPFYSRLVATLNPCMPDVATDLVTCLKTDFRFHVS